MQNKNVLRFQCHHSSLAVGWEYHKSFLLLSCTSTAAEVGPANLFSHLDPNFLESEGYKNLSTLLLTGVRIWIGHIPSSMVVLQKPVELPSSKISPVHRSSCWNRLQSPVRLSVQGIKNSSKEPETCTGLRGAMSAIRCGGPPTALQISQDF